MNVLMVSIDRKILEEGSAVRARMVEYGTICDELHIIIPTHNLQFTRQNFAKQNLGGQATHNQRIQISENVFAYPAVGSNRIFTLFQVYRLGIRILATSYQLPATSSLVTSQDPFETGFVAWLVARKTKAKLQLQIHTDFLSPYFVRGSLLNRIRVLLARFILPRADGIRVVSERIKTSLSNVKCQMSNVSILPIFIDAPKIMSAAPQFNLHKKYPQFDFIVLTTARLEPEKNITLALMAMKKVIAEYPRVGFIIVGSGSEMKNLKLKTIDYRLKTSVIFAGWQDDLVSYYKTADLYISTSDYEGYGLSLAEAALSGCPIVTTDAGIAGSVLKEGVGAFICSPRDANCLSGKVLKIIADKELQKRLKRAALAEVLGKVSKNKEEYLSEYKKTWEIKNKEGGQGGPVAREVFNFLISHRVARYLMAGGAGASVNLAALYFFTEYIGFYYLVSVAVAFFIAFAVSFTLQKFWTFKDKSTDNIHGQALMYLIVSVSTNFFLNIGLMYFFVDTLRVWYILAQVISGGLIAMLNFIIYRNFIFRNR